MTISAQIKLSRRVFSGSYSAQFGQRAQLPIDLRTGDDYDHVAGRFKWRCNKAGAARMLVYKGGADNTTRPLLGWHANGRWSVRKSISRRVVCLLGTHWLILTGPDL